jgi:hypothetical protein
MKGYMAIVVLFLITVEINWQEIEPPTKLVTEPTKLVEKRPEMCRHLMRSPELKTWNPVTETYPRNKAWEKCMGVN